jgi:hypothetical protein
MLCRKPQFNAIRLAQSGNYEGDPLSPPKGEAAQGEHPLDPPLFRWINISLMRGYHNWGMPEQRGRKHHVL